MWWESYPSRGGSAQLFRSEYFLLPKQPSPLPSTGNSSHGTEHLCKGMELIFSFALLEIRYSSYFSWAGVLEARQASWVMLTCLHSVESNRGEIHGLGGCWMEKPGFLWRCVICALCITQNTLSSCLMFLALPRFPELSSHTVVRLLRIFTRRQGREGVRTPVDLELHVLVTSQQITGAGSLWGETWVSALHGTAWNI